MESFSHPFYFLTPPTTARCARVKAFFQGSSTSGFKYTTKGNKAAGTIFDTGGKSDFDIAIANKEIFDLAKAYNYRVNEKNQSIGPLQPKQMKQLGIYETRQSLEKIANREVNFMLFPDTKAVQKKDGAISIEAKDK